MYRQIINLLILLLFFSFTCHGKSNNPQQLPINLQADQGEYLADQGVATYVGNVIITQGEMKLTGDKVVIRMQKGKVSSIEAWGKPATFHYVPHREPPIEASGLYLKYNVTAAMITIDKQARVSQGRNETRANHLTYDLKKENIKGQGVKMTFEPKVK